MRDEIINVKGITPEMLEAFITTAEEDGSHIWTSSGESVQDMFKRDSKNHAVFEYDSHHWVMTSRTPICSMEAFLNKYGDTTTPLTFEL